MILVKNTIFFDKMSLFLQKVLITYMMLPILAKISPKRVIYIYKKLVNNKKATRII